MSMTDDASEAPPGPGRRLKVLYVITRSERGGAQVHVGQLLRGLRQGVEAHLVVGSGDADTYLIDVAREHGVPVTRVASLMQPISAVHDLRAYRAIIRAIDAFGPDLVHAHSSKAGLLARLAAARRGVPWVFTAHGWAFADGVRPVRRWVGLLSEMLAARVGRGRQVISVSEYDRSLALRYGVVDAGRVTTIPNGMPDRGARPRHGDSGGVTITMVARFSEPKDQALLVSAMTRGLPDAECRFIGSGPTLPAIRRMAVASGVGDQIQFLGDRPDVPELLDESDIFVLASRHEGMPLSIIEAMRSGLPVIASAVGGVPELITHGVTGILIPPSDAHALHAALQRLRSDHRERLRIGRAARQRFLERYTEDVMLDRTHSCYREVWRLSRSPRGRQGCPRDGHTHSLASA